MQKKYLAFLTLLFLPLLLPAHPGHGETGGFTIIHYFTEPVHVLITVGVLFAGVVFISRRKKKSYQVKQDK